MLVTIFSVDIGFIDHQDQIYAFTVVFLLFVCLLLFIYYFLLLFYLNFVCVVIDIACFTGLMMSYDCIIYFGDCLSWFIFYMTTKINCTMLHLFDDLWLDKIIPKNDDRRQSYIWKSRE